MFLPIFTSMTAKQHEVFGLVADKFTSKEIAGKLHITESAVNQRIEAVRSRAGFPPRAELARAYRGYAEAQRLGEGQGEEASPAGNLVQQVQNGMSWQQAGARIVPAAFDGSNAGLNRLAAMVVIAAGLLAVAMMSLGVANALTAVVWPNVSETH